MNKLKPCPFCGGEVRHEMMMDGAMSWNCSICGLQARFPNDVFGGPSSKSWNARYEPTCHHLTETTGDNQYTFITCDRCGYQDDVDYVPAPNGYDYCPGCGAKVVG